MHLPVDDGERQLQVLCDLRSSALMHFCDDARMAQRVADESGIVPHALRLLRPEDRLAIRQGVAHPRADRVRVFTRERENVGQVNNGIAEVKDALAQGPRYKSWVASAAG